MVFDNLSPILAGFGLFVLASLMGLVPTRRFIEILEAKHELKQGSAGYLRIVARGTMVVLWLAGTWFCATIIADWGVSGDLDGAVARGMRRLEFVLILLHHLGD